MRQGNARIGSCKVGFVLAALAFAGAAWAGEVRSLALEHGVLVEAKGHNTGIADLKAALGTLDLNKLEAMKRPAKS